MQFGNATTDWYPVESMGGYFRLVDGILMNCPMLTDGSPDLSDGIEVDEIEVIFEACGDADNYARCVLIGRALAAIGSAIFEGPAGDVLPLACERCNTRAGDSCKHLQIVKAA